MSDVYKYIKYRNKYQTARKMLIGGADVIPDPPCPCRQGKEKLLQILYDQGIPRALGETLYTKLRDEGVSVIKNREGECPICLEASHASAEDGSCLGPLVAKCDNCSHDERFHTKCLDISVARDDRCPLCRTRCRGAGPSSSSRSGSMEPMVRTIPIPESWEPLPEGWEAHSSLHRRHEPRPIPGEPGRRGQIYYLHRGSANPHYLTRERPPPPPRVPLPEGWEEQWQSRTYDVVFYHKRGRPGVQIEHPGPPSSGSGGELRATLTPSAAPRRRPTVAETHANRQRVQRISDVLLPRPSGIGSWFPGWRSSSSTGGAKPHLRRRAMLFHPEST